MKTNIILLTLLLGLVFVSCKKDDSGTNVTPTPTPENWNFPADAATVVKLYCDTNAVAVNGTFDVKFVLYNVTGVVGVATEVSYNTTLVQVTSVLTGPTFTPDADLLTMNQIDVARSLVGYGITYKAGRGPMNGSGVIMKLKCKALAAGTATFTVNPAPKLEIRNATGGIVTVPISGPLSITIR